MTSLQLASPKIDGCSSLTDLNLKSCKKLTADGLAEFCAHSPPTLQTLNLSYTNLESLPSEIGNLQSLTKLDCYGCESLQSLPSTIGDCKSLTSLALEWCEQLKGLPSEIGNLQSLTKLNCRECWSLKIDKTALQAQ